MIYKINLSISGDNLFPEKIINKISGKFIVDSFHSPTDKKFEDGNDIYGYGTIFFWHPKKFASQDNVSEYEEAFVDFLENNYSLFVDEGTQDFVLYIEIYYDGGQCNFEVFNSKLLEKMARFRVSIPVSVYTLNQKELQEWEDEIETAWQ